MKHFSLLKKFLIFSSLIITGCGNDVFQQSDSLSSSPQENLILPENGLIIGDNQLVTDDGKIGIGTTTPASPLTVNGIIQSLVGGFRFPDGSLQTTASGTSCFGGTCAGDTTFSGQSLFTAVPKGASGTDASVVINPSSANANEPLFSVSLAGVTRMSIDAEGDVSLAGDLVVPGTANLTGLSCTGCISSTSIANNSINSSHLNSNIIGSSQITDASISTGDLANSAITSIKIQDGTIATDDLANSSVTEQKISPGSAEEVLTTNFAGNSEWTSPQIQYGLKFELLTAAQVRLSPSGINGKASVLVTDGTNLRSVVISANLTVDLTVSGAGGLDTGVEAANTGYDIYLITENNAANPALLLTISGSNPTLPPGYTFRSDVLWFISNTQGAGNSDIASFVDLGNGHCLYLVNNGLEVLNDGENTVITAINFTHFVPNLASLAKATIQASNANALTTTTLRLFLDAAGNQTFTTIANLINFLAINNKSSEIKNLDLGFHNGVANSIFYSFTSAPGAGDVGLNVHVKEWKLPRRMGL